MSQIFETNIGNLMRIMTKDQPITRAITNLA